MRKQESSDEIDRTAAEWAARLDGGQLTAEEETALDGWASADPRRFGALARAMAVLAQFDPEVQVQVEAPAIPLFAPRPPRARFRAGVVRRQLLYGGGAAAAALGLSLTGGVAYARRGQYRTGIGEVRSVPLSDGSVMWLNTDSLVKVRYGRAQRSVILARGEALFEVAKDPSRPFVVHAGETRVRAVGTAFSVNQLNPRQVRVLVNEGQVDFMPSDTSPPVRLVPGCNAVSGTAGGIAVRQVGVASIARALAWRRGQLDFDGVTLAEAAQTFAKYSDQRILIDDPRVARLTVSGLFASTDPVGFAKAVAVSLDLKARAAPGGVHLSR
jgi:transmembrane sensor